VETETTELKNANEMLMLELQQRDQDLTVVISVNLMWT
jgi:hypothetical protein